MSIDYSNRQTRILTAGAGVLLAATIGAGFYYVYILNSGIDMPSFISMTRKDTEDWAAENKIGAERMHYTYRFDEEIEKDTVLNRPRRKEPGWAAVTRYPLSSPTDLTRIKSLIFPTLPAAGVMISRSGLPIKASGMSPLNSARKPTWKKTSLSASPRMTRCSSAASLSSLRFQQSQTRKTK
ncbi:MAG: hypothetical protein IJH44_01480 [Solobacterium sp.]|nr:hypothetical protein [Solobacterium sp.]